MLYTSYMSKSFYPALTPSRGAPANVVPTRFNLNARVADGDWLDTRELLDGPMSRLPTTVTE